MTDTIIKGTGNSRTLKTVPNAAALYPDFDAFLAALVAGTLPIDIGPLNLTGVQVKGTDLTKGNLLTDATAQGIGLTGAATPNDAFAKLRALITTAQDTANGKGNSIFGSYKGTGLYGESNPCSITLPFQPRLMIILYGDYGLDVGSFFRQIMFVDKLPTEYTQNNGFFYNSNAQYSYGKKSSDGKTISWYNKRGYADQLNGSNIYRWAAFG